MEQEAVADFERGLLDVFVGAMGWIAGLEGNDLAPSEVAELRAGRARVEPVFEKGTAGDVGEEDDLAAETEGRRRSDVPGSGMSVLGGAEDRLRLLLAVDPVDFGELQDREARAGLGRQRDILARRERTRGGLVNAERDRN